MAKACCNSISFKIVVLCVTTTIGAAIAIAFVADATLRDMGVRYAAKDLDEVARLNSELVARPFADLIDHARVMSETPPIKAILRMRNSGLGDTEPLDGFTVEQWLHRLENVFVAFLAAHPTYTQLRFIGLADGGRELVRVDRHHGEVTRVPSAQLRRKGNEPYLARLARSTRPYMSEVTHDRKAGDADSRRMLTLRMVHPVRDHAGATLGAIVISADYTALLRASMPQLEAGHTLTLLNDDTHRMTFVADSARPRFDVADDADQLPPGVGHTVTGTAQPLQISETMAVYERPVTIGRVDNPPRLRLVASVPTSILQAEVISTRRAMFKTMLGLVAATVVVATAFSKALVRPIIDLAERIVPAAKDLQPIELDGAASQEVVLIASALNDLSNRLIQRTEQAMAIFEGAIDGIMTVGPDGTIFNANSSTHRMFGYKNEELIGRNVETLIPHDLRARHRQLLADRAGQIGTSGLMGHREVFGLRRNGDQIPVEITLNSVTTGDEGATIAIIRDVSMRQERDRELQAAMDKLGKLNEELERSNRELNEFAYVASHDLKAPLRVIDNAARWLEQDLAEHLDEDTRESMDLLRSRVARMDRLLNDLLQHSRIGREKMPRKIVTARQVMDDILSMLHPPAGFTIDLDPALDEISVQAMPLRNVLFNLVSNALKHHDAAEGRISVSVRERADQLEFSVSDDGPGIPPEYHARVFQMFQTLKPRDQVEGSGLGLAMVQKTVELQGGKVSLESPGGRGCRFRFTWPKTEDVRITEEDAA